MEPIFEQDGLLVSLDEEKRELLFEWDEEMYPTWNTFFKEKTQKDLELWVQKELDKMQLKYEALKEDKGRVRVDRDGQKCQRCGKGTYEIADLNDELNGERHCNKCGHFVTRFVNG